MKRISFAAVIAVLSIVMTSTSCIKNSTDTGTPNGCTDVAVTTDSAALMTFARTNNLGAFTDTLGLYYQVVTEGTGNVPNAASAIYVTYTGELMNGTIFDSTTNSANTGYPLGELIPGWQLGLPKIKAGGHIRLLIPSAYGYGCQGSGSTVPTNSPLYFDITLVNVN